MADVNIGNVTLDLSFSSSNFSDYMTQRCRMCPRILENLDQKVGAYCIVKNRDISLICSVNSLDQCPHSLSSRNLDSNLHEMGECSRLLEVDNTVTIRERSSSRNSLSYFKNDQTVCFPNDFQFMDTVTSKRVDLSLVLRDDEAIKKWKNKIDNLKFWISRILKQYVLFKNCCINCENHPLGKLCKLRYIVIKDSDTDSNVLLRFNSGTEMEILEMVTLEKFQQELDCVLQPEIPLAGLDWPKSQLMRLINYTNQFPNALSQIGIKPHKAVLLVGPPGTGKSTLVRKVAQECNAYLKVIRGPEILNSYSGEMDEMVKLFEDATMLSENGPCILFLDELDSICPKFSTQQANHLKRFISQLCILLDNLQESNNLFVVGATNQPQNLDISLRRPGRFDQEIFIGVPSVKDRTEILQLLLKSVPLEEDVSFEQLAILTKGFVGADLSLLCHEVIYNFLRENEKSEVSNSAITMENFENALKNLKPSTARGSVWSVDVTPIKWEDIGGLTRVKERIRMAVEWPLLYPEAFRRMGLRRSKGILLYGPPGCCKTSLVQAAATTSNACFLSVNAAYLFSPYVGDSEKAISEVRNFN